MAPSLQEPVCPYFSSPGGRAARNLHQDGAQNSAHTLGRKSGPELPTLVLQAKTDDLTEHRAQSLIRSCLETVCFTKDQQADRGAPGFQGHPGLRRAETPPTVA